MKIKELIASTDYAWHGQEQSLENDVTGVFVGDLLSFVMGHGEEGQVWVTIQCHMNTIAVASLKEFSCIILAQGVEPDKDVIEKAKDEGIILMQTADGAYDICKKLVQLGV